MPVTTVAEVFDHVIVVFEARHPRTEDRLSRDAVRSELLELAAAAPATEAARKAAHGHLSPFPTLTRDLVSVASVLAWLRVHAEQTAG